MPEHSGNRPKADLSTGKDADSKWVTLGRVSGLFGVKGWMKIYSHTQPRENILSYPVWHLLLDGETRAYELKDGKAQGKGVIAQLEGIDDRDQAASLVKAEILIPREELPSTEEDEFYWTDLQGLDVVTVDDIKLGVVDYLFETGANDVIVVKGDKQRLIPFIKDVVIAVDLESRVITVDWDPDF